VTAPTINLSSRIVRESWTTLAQADIGGRLCLQHTRYPAVHILNDSAGIVWRLLSEQRRPPELAEGLADEFDVEPGAVLPDVLRLVGQLYRRALVRVDGRGASRAELDEAVWDRDGKLRVIELAARSVTPHQVDLEVTRRCNLRCAHCYVEAGPAAEGELSLTELIDLLGRLQRAGCLFLTITGGEPLCRPGLVDLLTEARRRGLAIGLLTNATLVTDRLAQRLGGLGLSDVQVSVYGAQARTHDRMTGVPGSWERMVAGVRRLAGAGVSVGLKYLVTRDNFAQRRRVAALADRLGVGVHFNPQLTPRADGGLDPLRFRLDERQATVLIGEGLYRPVAARCLAGVIKCRITPWGDVQPCEFIYQPIGNLRQADFAAVWSSEAAAAVRTADWVGHTPEGCLNCNVRAWCARCPALARQEHGDYQGCHQYSRLMAEAARRALGGERGGPLTADSEPGPQEEAKGGAL